MTGVVLCRLPHGIVLEEAGQVVSLNYGVNDEADVELVQRWLTRNANLACVKNRELCIVQDAAARRARDITPRKTA